MAGCHIIIIPSSRVIDDIVKTGGPQPVLLFYCEKKDPAKSDPTNVLASLLRQLLRAVPPSSPTLSRLLEQYEFSQTLEELPLTDLILELAHEFKRTFVIIDGLDECDDLDSILLEISRLAETLSVFISSRGHADIRTELGAYEKITIERDYITEDVRKYVEVEVKRKVRSPKLRASVINELVSEAQGT